MAGTDENSPENTALVAKTDGIEPNKPNNPFFSFFPNLLQLFNFPPPKNNHTVEQETKPASKGYGDEDAGKAKPDYVTFPRQSPPPLKLEAEEPEKNTNPLVLWQVYAIGGFFVLRWALARWKERMGKKKPSNEEPPPADTDI